MTHFPHLTFLIRHARNLFLLAILMLGVGGQIGSAPFAEKIPFTQPDGSPIEIWGQGDEFYATFETLDGYSVVFDQALKGYCYAKLTADGSTLESTKTLVGQVAPETLGVAKHLRMSDAARRMQITDRRKVWEDGTENATRWNELKAVQQAREDAAASGIEFSPPSTTTVGTKFGLTLLIDFDSDPATIPQASIVNYLNGDNYTSYGNNGSVKKYFQDVSNNKLTYSNVVTIYIRIPNSLHPKSYYNDTTKSAGNQANLLIRDAINVMTNLPNYNTAIRPAFDTLTVDAGNNIIACNVFYAGGNGGVWSYGLWPHSWSLYNVGSQALWPGGKKVYKYQVTNIGSSLSISTFCHENGHMLCGFPDIYDYDYDSAGGAGRFCLMNSGASGGNPSQVCAYLKRAAGWATTIDLTSASSVTAVLTAPQGTNFNVFYRYAKPGTPREYYLFENRQKTGRDAGLPAAGIAIWHIDEQGNKDFQNTNYNTTHTNYECSLVQADGLWHFERDMNSGDAYDLYYANNTAAGYQNRFDDTSYPRARWWNGSNSLLKVFGISGSAPTMTMSIGTPQIPLIFTQPLGQTVYQGANVGFSVYADGAQPLGYQWRLNGVPLAGATATNLALTNVQFIQGGNYSVVVTNGMGAVTSTVARLIVLQRPMRLWTFNNVNDYTNNFSAFNTADSTPNYYYSERANGGVTNSRCLDISATDATAIWTTAHNFSIQNRVLGVTMTFKFKAQTSGTAGRVLQLGFLNENFYPYIANDGVAWMSARVNTSGGAGSTTTYLQHQHKVATGTVSVYGPTNTMQNLIAGRWYRLATTFENDRANNRFLARSVMLDYGADGLTPGPVIHVIDPTWVTNASMVTDGSVYAAFRGVDNTGADLLDDLTVYTNGILPVIISHPDSQFINAGQAATFNIAVDGGTLLPLMQWYSNGVAIADATNVVYTTPLLNTNANQSDYWVVISNSFGMNTSSLARVFITPNRDAPQLVSAGAIQDTVVGIAFSETMEESSLVNPANYVVPGSKVLSVLSRQNGQAVELTLSTPVVGPNFVVLVNNLRDFCGNVLPNGASVTGIVQSWWTPMDVGSPIMPGSVFPVGPGDVDLTVGGADLYNTADSGFLLSGSRNGNFDVRVRLAANLRPAPSISSVGSPPNSHDYAKFGLMVRESTNANSRDVHIVAFPATNSQYAPSSGRYESSQRLRTGQGQTLLNNSTAFPVDYPDTWMRLRRFGDTITTYVSPNGYDWTRHALTTQSDLPDALWMGLAGSAHQNAMGVTVSGQFREYGDFAYDDAVLVISTNLPASITNNDGEIRAFTLGANSPSLPASEILYLWQRAPGDGNFANLSGTGSTNSTFATAPLAAWRDNGSQYRCIVSLSGGNMVTSAVTRVTVNDLNPPTLVLATNYTGDTNGFTLVFSESITEATATNLANYFITNSAGEIVAVLAARFIKASNLVQITTASAMTNGTVYRVTVTNLLDLSGKNIAANSAAAFTVRNPLATPVSFELFNSLYYNNNIFGATNEPRMLKAGFDTNLFLSQLGYNTNLSDSSNNYYTARAITYFVPPSNGVYRFYLRSDDSSLLFMNTNAMGSTDPAGKTLLAYLAANTANYTNTTGLSPGIPMTAGQQYYLETWMADGTGGDGFSVMFREQGDASIPGNGLCINSNFLALPLGSALVTSLWPTNPVLPEGVGVRLYASSIGGAVPQSFQWLRNGVPLPGANSPTLLLPGVIPEDDQAVYTFVVSNQFSRAEISTSLSVQRDTTSPLITKVAGTPTLNNIVVTFSEPVSSVTAHDLGNYQLTGGLTLLGAALQPDGSNLVLWTSIQTPGAQYSVTINNVTDRSEAANLLTGTRTFVFRAWQIASGFLTVELYTNLTGAAVSNLTGAVKYQNNQPDLVATLASFDWRSSPLFAGGLDNYGARIYGWFVAPSNGLYRFYLRSDDASQLFMNTNSFNSADPADKSLVAREDTAPHGYTNVIPYQTPEIPMTAGQAYYMEALLKAGTGTDYLQVAVRESMDSSEPVWVTANSPAGAESIPGKALAVLGDPGRSAIEFTSILQPAAVTLMEDLRQTASFSVLATSTPPNHPVFYQWQIAGGDGIFYNVAAGFDTSPAYAAGNLLTNFTTPVLGTNSQVRVIASVPGNSVTSEVAVVTVISDTNAPVLVRAISGAALDTILLTFSEPMTGSSVTNVGNYFLSGSVSVQMATLRADGSNVVLATSRLTAGSNYTVTVSNVLDSSSRQNVIADGNTQIVNAQQVFSPGFLTLDIFTNLTGSTVATLTNALKYIGRVPDYTTYIRSFGYRSVPPLTGTGTDNYGAKIWGCFAPPASNSYHFYLRNDDQAQLYVNTNHATGESPVGRLLLINGTAANLPYTDGDARSASADYTFRSGRRYYIEGLLKENIGNDFLQATFRDQFMSVPTPQDAEVAPAQYFAAVVNPIGASLTLLSSPTNTTILGNQTVTYNIKVAADPVDYGVFYQWEQTNSAGSGFLVLTNYYGDTNTTFNSPFLTTSTFIRLVVSVPGAVITSQVARVTVNTDNRAPTILSVGSLSGREVGVVFSEPVDAGSATTPTNYRLNGQAGRVANVLQSADGQRVTLQLNITLSSISNFTVNALNIMDTIGNNAASLTAAGMVEGPFYVAHDVGGGYQPGEVFVGRSNEIQITSSGTNLFGGVDQMFLAYRRITNNFDVRVRLNSLSKADQWTKAGLAVRVSTNANSRGMTLAATPSDGMNLLYFQYRDTAGGGTTLVPGPAPAYTNVWLRLQRVGSVIYSYTGTNGIDWQLSGSRDTTPNGGVYASNVVAGLVVSSGDVNGGYTTVAQFRSLYFVPPPVIASPLSSATNYWGDTALLTVNATGVPEGGALYYQWRFNGTNLVLTTTNTLVIPNVRPEHAGNYDVVIGNTGGEVISGPVSLVVNLKAPVILVQPQPQWVVTGSNAFFEVQADGSLPLTYQWYEILADNTATNQLGNATNANVILSDVSLDMNSNSYFVAVSNLAGNTNSVAALLNVQLRAIKPKLAVVGPTNDFQLKLTATSTNRQYWLEYKIGLDDSLWKTAGDTNLGNGGEIQLDDVGATNSPLRFYRVGTRPRQ